jgi:hypothetical protein
MDLPKIEEIRRVELKPGDVLVVRTAKVLSVQSAEDLKRQIETRFPGHLVVVMDSSLSLEVLEPVT